MEQEKTFSGIALHDKFKNGKAAGQIVLTEGTIRFQSDQGGVEIPLHDITVKRGGSSGQLVTFEHRSYPGWYIYTEEKSILRKLNQISRPDTDISTQVKGIKKIRRRVRGLILGIILAIAALILILLQIRNPVAKAIAKSIPVEWEQSLGESVFEQYKAQKKIIDDPEVIASLDKITTPLLSRIPDKRYDFKIYIVEDASINAFALPGGYMALHTGLLLNVEHAEELLGVLAHEISHVTLQHGLRKLIDSMGLLIMIKAFFGDSSGIWGEVVKSGAFLLDQQFSRSFEREADETGFSYLVNAGIDPGGMIGFFQRLEEERKKVDTLNLEEKLNFLSTHPVPAMRIKYLNKKLKQLRNRGEFLNFETDFRVFKETLKRKVSKTQPSN
jgi:predicted Zn-dependent protease